MAKNKNYSLDDLIAQGMVETSPGVFEKEKSVKICLPMNVTKTTAGVVDTLDFTHKPKTEWFIPYQVPSKKNSTRLFIRKNGGKAGQDIPGTTVSDSMKKYKTTTKMYWEIFALEFKKAIIYNSLKFPLNIEMTFIRGKEQRFDYFGPGETIADFMAEFGWIPDDDTKHIKPHFGDYEINNQNPGVRIKILL